MTTVAIPKAQGELSEALRRVETEGERIVLEQDGRPMGALVSLEDLRFLEELEDRIDLEEARRALEEPGSIPWEELKAELGL
ncbi:MAG: type II toxin-antitoxin system Phd/YefM family antitoxin [Deltaproteobacteria bacterium]|nr:type II toxin-antitoxin system Phd/YefM family antitoxin [Deltaproteobacteria bacterium]